MLTRIIGKPLPTTNGLNTDHDTSAPGLDVAIVKSADPNYIWVLDSIHLSYRKEQTPAPGDAPLGQIIVMDGDKIIFDQWINLSTMIIDTYLPTSPGNALTVTLKAGGVDTIGKLNIQTHLEMEW